jgi:DNA-binding LytR/AlgR family response regulator
MSRPTAVIAEDEPLLREELQEALAALWPELHVVAVAEDGIEAVRALERHAPTVLFLDIQMPGMTGLDVARAASGRCHVVFVTAYDQYAVAAFEQGAVDYVMKPFAPARLAMALARLRDRMRTKPANLGTVLDELANRSAEARPHLRWISVSQGQNIRLITVDEICYFQVDNKYTLVTTADTQSMIKKPLRELLEQLDPEVFWQVHRGTIVNVNAIASVHRDLRGYLHVRLKARKETLPVSMRFANRFRQM